MTKYNIRTLRGQTEGKRLLQVLETEN